MSVRGHVGRWVARADRLHSRAMHRWRRVLPFGQWMIVPYLGYGTRSRLCVSGRVLRHVAHLPPEPAHGSWRNFLEFWKRMESDELPGARVRVQFRDLAIDTIADDEGHFSAALELPVPLAEDGWQRVRLMLIDPPGRGGLAEPADIDILVPAQSAKFGVVSDIDDTVLWSNVGRKLRMLAMLMRSNVHTRKPFKGVAAFYQALHRGVGGNESNPLFYVSSSPWNLYEPLVSFLELQGLPRGPLMLKDFGEHLLFGGAGHHAHKRSAIDRLLATYPELPFVLIGDSGEQDPEIYADIVHTYPQRIRVVYIRSVDPDPSRIEAIDELIATVQVSGAQLVLAPDSELAAVHAAGAGLISAAALAEVRADKREDQRAPPT